jgi:tetratricopeptide (TPR) repeat protein
VGLHLVYKATKQQSNKATKRTNKAVDVLMKSLTESPNSLLSNTALAKLYIDQSQWHKADEIYQALVEQYPKHLVILNNASYVALNLSDYQRAEVLVKKSLALVDNQPDSLDTLGWIYYHRQKFNEALPLFRKALAINNSNPVVKYHLALALKALNRDNEAIKLMVEVVNSDYSKKADADALLKQWLK